MSNLGVSIWEAALVIAGIVIAGVVVTRMLKRRRQQVWHQLADWRGLRFEEAPAGPRVTGRLAERKVEIFIDEASSDRDVGGVEVLRMQVGLRDTPDDMSAQGEPGILGDLALAAEERISFDGSPEFDRNVLVKGPREADIRGYWDSDRQKVFLDLVLKAPCDQVAIENGVLAARLREIVSDRSRLDKLLDLLLEAAPGLDGG